MDNRWKLYQSHPSFVLGFHGTESQTVEDVVSRRTKHLKQSAGKYEWLGHGVYFWENDPARAHDWAETGKSKSKIKDPAIVGAVIDLGRCLDLTTLSGLNEVKEAYALLKAAYTKAGKDLPKNDGGLGNPRRELDCQVIQALHIIRSKNGLPAYDSIRSFFPEDQDLYDNAGFRAKNHIQICVCNVAQGIKGYFVPIDSQA